jgi:hypothetical protein
MPRHILRPLPRGNPPARAGASGSRQVNVGMDWSKLDRVQVLGTGRADDGHTGYAQPTVSGGNLKLGQHQADAKMCKRPIVVGRWRYSPLRLRRQAVRFPSYNHEQADSQSMYMDPGLIIFNRKLIDFSTPHETLFIISYRSRR